ncbi:hypothetical protein pb186bvf_003993 [Paramecium bursaria]
MLRFRVQLPEDEDNIVQVNLDRSLTVKDLKELIKQTSKIEKEIDIIIYDQVLSDEGGLNKIIYSQDEDIFKVQYKPNQYMKRLSTFIQEAKQQIQQKGSAKQSLLLKSLTLQPQNNQQNQEQLETKQDKPQFKRLMTFFSVAKEKIKEKAQEKNKQLEQKLFPVLLNQPSNIQNDEEPYKNNDTVINILDDMNRHKLKKELKQIHQRPHHSPSPQAQAYIRRKQRALETLNDPNRAMQARLLVQEMRKQRQLLERKKQEINQNRSEILNESVEQYKKERVELQQILNEEKRQSIKQRLEEHQRQQELQKQINKNSIETIQSIKNKIKQERFHRKQMEEQFVQQQQQMAKTELDKRKQIAKPIRLNDINSHAQTYMENLNRLKLEKEQQKLEREIKIQQETKQMYKARQFLDNVIKNEEEVKMKDIVELRQKRLQQKIKQKYAELVNQFHKPLPKIDAELKQSKIDSKDNFEYSRQDIEIIDALQHDRYRKKDISNYEDSSIKSRMLQEKNLKKIKVAISQQNLPKTQITESLKVGKVPKKSNPHKIEYEVQQPNQEDLIIQERKQKGKQYLREQKELREQQRKKSLTPTRKSEELDYDKQIQQLKRRDLKLQRIEREAVYKKDDQLENDASELLLLNIKAKLKFLEAQT